VVRTHNSASRIKTNGTLHHHLRVASHVDAVAINIPAMTKTTL